MRSATTPIVDADMADHPEITSITCDRLDLDRDISALTIEVAGGNAPFARSGPHLFRALPQQPQS